MCLAACGFFPRALMPKQLALSLYRSAPRLVVSVCDALGYNSGTSFTWSTNIYMYDLDRCSYIIRMTELRLQIAIVGAGLGGLVAAIGIARAGHKVTILEQATVLGEVSFHLLDRHDWEC